MSTHDDSDKLREGTLHTDPAEDAILCIPCTESSLEKPETGWDRPLPLSANRSGPPFPVQLLPPWLSNWASGQAEALQCPVDLPSTLGLTAVSACVAKKFDVHATADHHEPVNLYTATALKPGEHKSPAFSAALKPIEVCQRELRRTMEPQIQAQLASLDIADKRLKRLKEAAAKELDLGKQSLLEERVREEAEALAKMKTPVLPQLVADDTSAEALAELLRQHHGRMAIFSDEGGPFELMAGRYSDGNPNFEVYLKGHSGGAITINRISRAGGIIPCPILTIGLAVQPHVISGLLEKKGFRGKGLLARFLYVIPRSRVGSRRPNPRPLEGSLRSIYDWHIRELLSIPLQLDEDDEPTPRPIHLSREASDTLVTFRAALEPRLGPGGDLESIADWGNKLCGTILRLAGLLHIMDCVPLQLSPDQCHISGDTMRRAILLGEYFLEHALVAFDIMGADPAIEDGQYILEWIRRHRHLSFTKSQVYCDGRARFKSPRAVDPGLDILIEHGFLRRRPPDAREGPGRSRSPIFDVNPLIHAENAENATAKTRAEGGEAA